VKDGSGRCQVFLVSRSRVNTLIRSMVKRLGVSGYAQHDSRFYIKEPTQLALASTNSHGATHMVVYGLEDLLGSNQQRRHLPDGHFKVHLGELEEPEDLVSHALPGERQRRTS